MVITCHAQQCSPSALMHSLQVHSPLTGALVNGLKAMQHVVHGN